MSFATASHASGLRLEMTTVAPCSAMRVAMASPIPLVEPVTIATLPVRSNSDDMFGPLSWRFGERSVCSGPRKRSNQARPMLSKRTTVYSRAELTKLLDPASVAVIGASTRAGSFGERVLHNLRHYGGRYYPVNARYETIGDLKCY